MLPASRRSSCLSCHPSAAASSTACMGSPATQFVSVRVSVQTAPNTRWFSSPPGPPRHSWPPVLLSGRVAAPRQQIQSAAHPAAGESAPTGCEQKENLLQYPCPARGKASPRSIGRNLPAAGSPSSLTSCPWSCDPPLTLPWSWMVLSPSSAESSRLAPRRSTPLRRMLSSPPGHPPRRGPPPARSSPPAPSLPVREPSDTRPADKPEPAGVPARDTPTVSPDNVTSPHSAFVVPAEWVSQAVLSGVST